MTQYFADVTTVPGMVREIVEIPDGAELDACVHADFATKLVSCTSSVRQGWTYSAGTFAAPVETVAQAQAAAIASASGHFAGLLQAGYTLSAVVYALDSVSIAKATAAGSAASATLIEGSGVSWPVGFSYPDAGGDLQPMTALQMLAVANALFHFVAAAEANLGTIVKAIAAAGSVDAVAAIDVTAGYPGASS